MGYASVFSACKLIGKGNRSPSNGIDSFSIAELQFVSADGAPSGMAMLKDGFQKKKYDLGKKTETDADVAERNRVEQQNSMADVVNMISNLGGFEDKALAASTYTGTPLNGIHDGKMYIDGKYVAKVSTGTAPLPGIGRFDFKDLVSLFKNLRTFFKLGVLFKSTKGADLVKAMSKVGGSKKVGKFLGWGNKTTVTKSSNDFTKDQLINAGYTQEVLNSIYFGLIEAAKKTINSTGKLNPAPCISGKSSANKRGFKSTFQLNTR